MSDHLKVEKQTQRVNLFMADGVIFDGHVYLSQYAMNHSGEQTMLDLLTDGNPFLPMNNANGEFQLIQKGMISHVRCDVPLNDNITYTQRRVKISFPDNDSLSGVLKIDMPSHSIRLTDYINSGNDFFPLFSGEVAYLVNRNLIRDIVLLEE